MKTTFEPLKGLFEMAKKKVSLSLADEQFIEVNRDKPLDTLLQEMALSEDYRELVESRQKFYQEKNIPRPDRHFARKGDTVQMTAEQSMADDQTKKGTAPPPKGNPRHRDHEVKLTPFQKPQ